MSEKEIDQSSCEEATEWSSRRIQQPKEQNINMKRTAFHSHLLLMGKIGFVYK